VANKLVDPVQLIHEPRISTGWPAGKLKPLTAFSYGISSEWGKQ